MTEDEEFFAWLDGELQGERAQRVAERVAASPDLTAEAERHRQLATGLRQAFAPVMGGDIPSPRFQQAEIVDFGARAAGRGSWRSLFGFPQWAAMAATLALGFVTGNMISGGGNESPVAIEGGRLVATAALGQSLDTKLASAPSGTGTRIGLTFRDSAGHICRSFTDDAASGLACRDDGNWRIRGLFQGTEVQSSDYRMAAGQDSRLAQLIDQEIASEPLDAAAERAARDRGWR